MAYAYYEKIARINLTTGEIKVEKLDVELAKKFIGGRGLGTKIVYDEGCATADPLGPDNKLVYITGPLTGAGAPSSGRYMVVTKSPLTGMIACSNSGGIWGAKLKYAGWDALIVEGEAPEWTYINIVDDKIELLDAREYLGLFSEDCDEKLKEKHGKDSSVLSIGIAGEKQVLLAAIMNDKDRAAGRSGVGAVMGSKKLKGIVVKASKKNADETLASVDALKAANKDVMVNIRENGLTGGGLRALGTASLVTVINGVGSLPTKNWQEAYYDKAEDVSGEALAEKFLVKAGACHRCPIACGRVVKVNDKVVGGPEYEPLWAYGANMANNDLAAVNEANYWCNEYGLDAISVPCTIAAAMELYQRGAIKEEDCAGYPLEWGSVPALIEWTKRMGDPKTELDWLMSSGSARLCEHFGLPEVSMSVKKQEMPAYDARGVQGIGITYATSNRGGCHVRGYTIAPEVVGLPVQLDRTVTDEKAFWSKTFQDLTAVIDSMGLCLFTSFALGAPEYTKLLNAACGTEYTPEQVLEIGERIYNIERMFNKAAGMKPEDDRLPKRLLEEPIPNGPSKGLVSKLHITLPDYYRVRGWEAAFPTDETLKRLGLDECVGK
ncbi:MAG: aldehyde ferredoxin oxidoreductase family protein [Oscillospiraceae bacterium]|nr:aldehyde ferredoxin oxidoreductase family protein [Oscillospiraceae bacterium]